MAKKRRFKAQESTVTKQLVNVMTKMGATNLRVDKQLMGDPIVHIMFDRAGRRYKFTCESYDNPLDNYRASQLTIEYLYRALESYGVSQGSEAMDTLFSQFMLGFEATPDDTTLKLSYASEWYEVLGVAQNAPLLDIKNAYRSLIRFHHPDVGGDPAQFKKIQKAYDEALVVRG